MAVLPNDRLTLNAGVAQLVERYLAKVQVASSNLVSRSNSFVINRLVWQLITCRILLVQLKYL